MNITTSGNPKRSKPWAYPNKAAPAAFVVTAPLHAGAYPNPPEGGWVQFQTDGTAGDFSPRLLYCPQPYAGRIRIAQVTLVIVHPQRGQSDPVPERQVVPQCEQVLADVRGLATLPQA